MQSQLSDIRRPAGSGQVAALPRLANATVVEGTPTWTDWSDVDGALVTITLLNGDGRVHPAKWSGRPPATGDEATVYLDDTGHMWIANTWHG